VWHLKPSQAIYRIQYSVKLAALRKQTRHSICVSSKTKARSLNHSSRGKEKCYMHLIRLSWLRQLECSVCFHIDLHVECPLFLSGFKETWIFSTGFGNLSNIKFRRNLSIGSRVFPCGQRDGWTDRHEDGNGCFSQFCERT
jgi:hypothetical protein